MASRTLSPGARRRPRGVGMRTIRGEPQLPKLDMEAGNLMATPDVLSALRAFEPEPTQLERLSTPNRAVPESRPSRKRATLVPAHALPPMVDPPDPSSSLRQDTAAVAYRAIEKVMPSMLARRQASELYFSTSTSRLDLPLQASVTSGSSARSGLRLGDALNQSRMQADLTSSSISNLRYSRSSGSLRSRSMTSSRASDPRFHGRSLMVSGGAPLSPAAEYQLNQVQLGLLRMHAAGF